MTAPARRISPSPGEPIVSPQIIVDRGTSVVDLVRLAFKDRQVSGHEPFAAEFSVDVALEASTLLPRGAAVVRHAVSDQQTVCLARTDRASVLVLTSSSWTLVAVASTDDDQARALLEQMRARVPADAAPDTVPIRTWYAHGDSIHSNLRDITAPDWASIDANYPGAVRDDIAALAALTPASNAGKLVLWHGPPGTGKTTALRALMRAWAPWCDSHYIADPERFFAQPGYIAEVVADRPSFSGRRAPFPAPERWQLLVAEDCDEYLRASARRDAGAALGRLLNLADGVLGQGHNIIILLTTNEDVRRLHPALTRPGRCLAHVEFRAFTPSEARQWLPPGGPAPHGPLSLAELYALRTQPDRVRPAPREAGSVGQYL